MFLTYKPSSIVKLKALTREEGLAARPISWKYRVHNGCARERESSACVYMYIRTHVIHSLLYLEKKKRGGDAAAKMKIKEAK